MQHARNPHQEIADRVMRELDGRAPVVIRYHYSPIVKKGPWIIVPSALFLCLTGGVLGEALGSLLLIPWAACILFALVYFGYYIRDQRRNFARKRAVDEALRYAAYQTK